MTKTGTLKELGVKPGDVVEWLFNKSTHIITSKNIGLMYCNDYRIISRAAETPKLWHDMTPEEKGALLLAEHDSGDIEHHCDGMWVPKKKLQKFLAFHAYRVKPERTKSDWSAWFVSKQDGTTKLNLDTCADVERVALGDSKQFAYRVKKWVE